MMETFKSFRYRESLMLNSSTVVRYLPIYRISVYIFFTFFKSYIRTLVYTECSQYNRLKIVNCQHIFIVFCHYCGLYSSMSLYSSILILFSIIDFPARFIQIARLLIRDLLIISVCQQLPRQLLYYSF